jgi:hypothetical protein
MTCRALSLLIDANIIVEKAQGLRSKYLLSNLADWRTEDRYNCYDIALEYLSMAAGVASMFVSVAGITDQIDLQLAVAFYSRPGSSGLNAESQEAGWFSDQPKSFLCNQVVAGEPP